MALSVRCSFLQVNMSYEKTTGTSDEQEDEDDINTTYSSIYLHQLHMQQIPSRTCFMRENIQRIQQPASHHHSG